MDYLKRPRFPARRGLFACEDIARYLDETTRFYQVRCLSLLPDYTKWCAHVSACNDELFSDSGQITGIMMVSKLSENTEAYEGN